VERKCVNCKYVDTQVCYQCAPLYKCWVPRTDATTPVITLNEYQQSTARTDSHDNQRDALTNFAFGICGEAGEIVDLVKKVVFHGHSIDVDKFKHEIGDQLWYLARTAEWVGLSLEEVAQANIEKLQKRYPDGFDKDKSINREEYK